MYRNFKKLAFLWMFFFYGIIVAASETGVKTDDKLNIVTTTTIFKDLVESIGGEKVKVTSLMGEGINVHSYTASAGDLNRLDNADIIIYGGLHLEGRMGAIFDDLENSGKNVLSLGDNLDKSLLLYRKENHPDPHTWFDTQLWILQSKLVADKLSEIDEKNKDYYMNRYESYKEEIEELRAYVKSRIEEIPEESRVLITAHGAYSYFGRQFKFEIRSVRGINANSESGTKDIIDLADFIIERNIKAIFVETSVSHRVVEALQEAVSSKGVKVKIGGELYSESLGDKERDTETYIKTFKRNIDIIAEALK